MLPKKNYKIYPNNSFSLNLKELVNIHFSIPSISLDERNCRCYKNIKTKKKRNSKIDVEIPWTPPKPTKELTHFKIIFTDKNKNNMKHVDYIFAIKGKMDKLIAHNIQIHSGWGIEMTQLKINQSQNLFLELTITGISFQPIDTQKVKFVFE